MKKQTLIEKIIAAHSIQEFVKPNDIVDVFIDCRAARDFGGANVVKNLFDNHLKIADPARTFFTFDCNPGGSDQKYAQNQHICRQFAQRNNITVLDINNGIGTHSAIDLGLAKPGSTFVSTDSHANIMGAIGCFGQGMGDQDIAAAWSHGSIWFKVPESVKITIKGKSPNKLAAKDIVLNLLRQFGANSLLGCSVELYGELIEELSLDERITIASMATEMGAIIIFLTPNAKILNELTALTKKTYQAVVADEGATYSQEFELDASKFQKMIARPGHPHDTVAVKEVQGIKIDSAFIGSCTNGRIEDLRIVADILKGKHVAKDLILKIVPATDRIWNLALEEGLIKIFKEAGALVSNPGCAGCAAGQIGQNGQGEVTISTGNRNFAGKQGKGDVYLASPSTVAASAIAGYITSEEDLSEGKRNENLPYHKPIPIENEIEKTNKQKILIQKPTLVSGRVWRIDIDDIDTDMIFHNRYLAITDIREMGQYALDNLKNFENFAKEAKAGDIILTGKNFGAGSSRQQAVDCFLSLGISAILAESYGAIYERNAINAALPILSYTVSEISKSDIADGDTIFIDFHSGEIQNITQHKSLKISPFYPVQMEIYQRGGLLMKD
jgi:3-isopropylmalate dehydratase small subunit